jgi:hypothetical protein
MKLNGMAEGFKEQMLSPSYRDLPSSRGSFAVASFQIVLGLSADPLLPMPLKRVFGSVKRGRLFAFQPLIGCEVARISRDASLYSCLRNFTAAPLRQTNAAFRGQFTRQGLHQNHGLRRVNRPTGRIWIDSLARISR